MNVQVKKEMNNENIFLQAVDDFFFNSKLTINFQIFSPSTTDSFIAIKKEGKEYHFILPTSFVSQETTSKTTSETYSLSDFLYSLKEKKDDLLPSLKRDNLTKNKIIKVFYFSGSIEEKKEEKKEKKKEIKKKKEEEKIEEEENNETEEENDEIECTCLKSNYSFSFNKQYKEVTIEETQEKNKFNQIKSNDMNAFFFIFDPKNQSLNINNKEFKKENVNFSEKHIIFFESNSIFSFLRENSCSNHYENGCANHYVKEKTFIGFDLEYGDHYFRIGIFLFFLIFKLLKLISSGDLSCFSENISSNQDNQNNDISSNQDNKNNNLLENIRKAWVEKENLEQNEKTENREPEDIEQNEKEKNNQEQEENKKKILETTKKEMEIFFKYFLNSQPMPGIGFFSKNKTKLTQDFLLKMFKEGRISKKKIKSFIKQEKENIEQKNKELLNRMLIKKIFCYFLVISLIIIFFVLKIYKIK